MKTLLSLALALALSGALVVGALAQQTQAPAGSPSQAPMGSSQQPMKSTSHEKLQKFMGTVERVDEAKKEIMVKKDGGKEMTFTWGDQTKFMEGKKDVSFSDLKEGMKVTVQYRREGDKFFAEKVNARMAKTASAKKFHSEKSSY